MANQRIYLDNASTSFPKAEGMAEAIHRFLEKDDVNPFRTTSGKEEDYFSLLDALRCDIANLYNYDHPECIGFTLNATHALNFILKGLLKAGDHVIISSQEHNAVMRPLSQIGLEYSKIPSDGKGFPDYSSLGTLLKRNTKAVIINVAGNVSGAIWPLEELSEFSRKHSLLFILDTSQATPYVDIDFDDLSVSALAFTGHKGLLGPEGTGGFLLREDIAYSIDPLVSGGSGSQSDLESVPTLLPDRLSAGTENTPGLVGLAHSVSFSLKHKDELLEMEKGAFERLYTGIESIDGVSIVGPLLDEKRVHILSVTTEGKDEADVAYFLYDKGGIETRVGLHCAPSAHKALGTFPKGTLRFSPGPYTTPDEIDYTIELLKEALM